MCSNKVVKIVAAFVCALVVTSAVALDPERTYFQYEFVEIPDDIELPFEIFDITQDRKGFIWLATARGLIRYNGLEYDLFRVSEYPELLSNKPTDLFIDSTGLLYVASRSGLSAFDGDKFKALIKDEPWATHIHAIAEDSSGSIWLGSDDGLWILDQSGLSQQFYASPFDQIRSLLWHGDKLYVGAVGVLHIIENNVQSSIELPTGFERARVRDIESHQGHIWMATRSGLLRVAGDSAIEVEDKSLKGLSFDVLLSDSDANLWFAGRRHLGRKFPDGRVELPNVANDEFGYSPEISQLFEDSSGRHWQTSRFFGLILLRDSMVNRLSYSEGLLSPNISAITANKRGAIIVATESGISSISENIIRNLTTGDFTGAATIQSMVVLPDMQLLVGTRDGLRKFDLQESRFLPSFFGNTLRASINDLVVDANKTVWVATDQGLYQIGENDVRLERQTHGHSIESLHLDSKGTLWLGTENGIASYANSKFEEHAVELSADSHAVISIVELPSGGIVAATADHGLLVRVENRWTSYSEQQGLPQEQIFDIEVRGQNLWMLTGAGIFRTSLATLQNPDAEEILVHAVVAAERYRSPFLTNCCRGENHADAMMLQDTLVASSDDGVVFFDTNAAFLGPMAPQPYIKHVSHSGASFAVDEPSAVTLVAQHNDITIDYSAMQLARGDRVEFRYRLRGQSEEWVNAGRGRTAQFNNLLPGDYIFELQASAAPNVWSAETASFAFKRPPNFVESDAFSALTWATLTAVGVLIVWLNLVFTRRRRKLLETEISERTLVLSELNAELRTANRELEQSSYTDPLTGLVNRRVFDTAKSQYQLTDKVAANGVLMMIDIDFFKRINDSYGHPVGDEVLCQFAAVLRSVTRQSDLVARWGGEEFVLICQCSDDDAATLLERICSAVRDHEFGLPDGRGARISCSIGSIRYPLWANHTLEDRLPAMLELADAALYIVKMNGRDGWVLLEGAKSPDVDAASGNVGAKLREFVESDFLSWAASRAEINITFDDTMSRLRAIKRAK